MRSRLYPGRWVLHRVHIHLYGWYLAPVTVDEPSRDGGKRSLVIVTCHLASPHGVQLQVRRRRRRRKDAS